MRILAQDDRALQSGMNSLNLAVYTILLFVNLEYMLQDVALWVWIPAAIASAKLYLHASHREAALHHGGDVLLVAVV